MAKKPDNLIIIRRPKLSDDDDGEHDGVWKIAYADFTTAMMAFFLVLWLATITTESQRDGLTDFFNPVSVSRSNSGGEGIMGGRSVDQQGSLTSPHAEGDRSLPVSSPPVEAEIGSEARAPYLGDDLSLPTGNEASMDARRLLAEMDEGVKAEMRRIKTMAESETTAMDGLEEAILNAIKAEDDLTDLLSVMLFERTPEGLLIQITDKQGFAMFATAQSQPGERAVLLLDLVARALRRVDNPIIVQGHTDGAGYSAEAFGNWELSAARANAARRLLESGGVAGDRIRKIEGMADRDPLIMDRPLDPRNRRIAIHVLRQTPLAVNLLPEFSNKYRR
ncbi:MULTISPECIES: flagellar motor protein MotB [unclassified Iodidimonas]|jgi:chemotaxis protein MotB|uniref:OmpA family protein n=1 Tax=unclassified Iodidimonas TaxID=2626145 RepID=UPI002482BDE4|nr:MULTISPECIES: flagellar motor protein MotB [unclassified Iodidimonas]